MGTPDLAAAGSEELPGGRASELEAMVGWRTYEAESKGERERRTKEGKIRRKRGDGFGMGSSTGGTPTMNGARQRSDEVEQQ